MAYKSKEYKRIHTVLWLFYGFFLLIILASAYISISELQRVELLNHNFRAMNEVYYNLDEIADETLDYDYKKEAVERINSSLDKIEEIVYEKNQVLYENIRLKANEYAELIETNDSKTLILEKEIKQRAKEFVENIYNDEADTLNQTKKMDLILMSVVVVTLTVVLLLVVFPVIKKTDNLTTKLRATSNEKEVALMNLKKQAHELYQREERFSSIAELSPVGLFMTDADGSCEYVNERYAELYGMSIEECMGEGWKDGIHPDDRERIFSTWYESVKNNDPIYANEYRTAKTSREISVKAKALRNEENKTYAFLGVIEDVTDANIEKQSLEESAEKLSELVENLPFGAAIYNESGVYFNKAVEEIIGYRNEEISTLDEWFDKLYGENSDRIRKLYEENKDKNFENPVLVELIHKDGSIKKVEFKDRNTENAEIWGLIDKTEILKLEAEKQELTEMYDLILNATKIGVWNWDVKNNKVVWNDSLFDLLGIERTSENLFETYMERVHDEDKQTAIENNTKLLNGEFDEFLSDFRFVKPSGELIYLRSISKIEKDDEGNPERMYGINIDITESKKHEKELVLAKEQADAANNAKSIFLANMSHEIRTPMNAILGFAEILRNKNETPELETYIEGITKGGNTLLSLINDILDLSKIEANKMVINNRITNFGNIVDDVSKIFSMVASKKGIEFKIEILSTLPTYMILDESKIKQILINLIGNAIKFTDKGGVNVNIYHSTNDSDVSKLDLCFEIKDTGKGIDESYIPNLFEPFTQEDSRDTKEYEGTGLGLSIVKKLVDLYDGEISVESEVGVGSIFKVRLSGISISIIKPNELSKIEQDQIDKIDFSDLNILFAEDIESNRRVVKGLLADSNLNLYFAENGEEALRIAKEYDIYLAFIDLHMPVMDGRTMAKIWNEDEELNKIPMVALTAEVNQSFNENESLFSEYLTKPVSGIDLYKAIAKFVSPNSDIHDEIDNPMRIELKLDEEIVNELREKDLIRIVEESTKAVNTRELRKLITEMNKLSEKYNDDYLETISNDLELALNSFDIEKIKSTLNQITNN